ncbi:hypothetical protein D3C79_941700 [compost metagenome]
MHHGQQVDTMGHQRRGVFQGDAADRADRQVQFAACLVEQVETAGRGAGFGVGIEEAAEGDVAGAFFDGLFGEVELRMAGRTDDCIETQQGAGRRQWTISLTQVHADIQACGQLSVIIDDQPGVVAFA